MFYKKGGENVKDFITIILLTAATIQDIRSYKVKNLYIILGYFAGLLFYLEEKGYLSIEKSISWILGMAVPILILWVLYRYKVIGAGDIKLFSVIGGLYGFQFIIIHMILALFLGAALSIIHFIRYKDIWYRLSYFMSYFSGQYSLKKFLLHPNPYYNKEVEGHKALIPYTVAITAGFLLCRYSKNSFVFLF